MSRDDEDDDPVAITKVKALRETDKALLCEIPGFGQRWVPKSVIHDDSEVYRVEEDDNNEGTLVVAGWFAEKEGLG